MSESAQHLKNAVAELEQALQEVDRLDGDSRSLLEETVRELQSALGENATEYRPDPTLADRLETAESEFQASHPTLSGIVMRLVDALGQFGI